MTTASNLVVGVAVGAVFVVLAVGVINMIRGGAGSPQRSQTLMRWRVGLQLVALLIALAVVYARGRW
jgi:hypothetical protein